MRRRPLLTVCWLCLILGGCVVGAVDDDDDDDSSVTVDDSGPRIRIFTYPPTDPPVIAFGEVEIGATGVRSFDVQNVGDELLDISAVSMTPSGSFALQGVADLVDGIDVGREVSIDVRYVPEEEEAVSTVLAIASNDPTRPVVEIAVSAEAVSAAD